MNKEIATKAKKQGKVEKIKAFPLDTVPSTFKSIWRNKRRSFAMLAGILLATTLLSGIILYNNDMFF